MCGVSVCMCDGNVYLSMHMYGGCIWCECGVSVGD